MTVSFRLTLKSMSLAVAIGLFAYIAPSDDVAAYELLTAEEFSERTDRAPTRSITKLANEGPEIIIHAPQAANNLRSPLDFEVEFRPREAEPDLATLKIEYDLGWFWKDVTGRMADHAEISDNRLISRGAELPDGDHHLRMSISDKAGKTTATEFVLTVAN